MGLKMSEIQRKCGTALPSLKQLNWRQELQMLAGSPAAPGLQPTRCFPWASITGDIHPRTPGKFTVLREQA